MRAIKLTILLLLSLAQPGWAQEATPPSPIVRAELAVDAPAALAAVTFTMPDAWHIYWKNPGDSGIPTALDWQQLPQGVTAGEILWPTPIRIDTSGIINYGYGHEVTLLVPLSGISGNSKGDVTVKASWLVCKDICIPESVTLTASLSTTSPAATDSVHKAQSLLPKPLNGTATYSIEDQQVTLRITTSQSLADDATFFPIEDGIASNSGAQTLSHRGQTYTFTLARGNAKLVDTWHGVIRSGNEGFDIAASKTAAPPAETASPFLPLILLLALVGGLLLNLMPCVLPILSLKALALAKKGGALKSQVRKQGISYAAGVVGGFLFIALIMLSLKSAGMAAGWGFQLQQPEVVAGLFLLMLLVALNLFGWFELPVLLGNAASRVSDATPLGSFCTGLLAVALATPCTTPFMAPAIGATLLMPTLSALLVFAALGFGMSLPFLIISFWPAALRLLPKPGAWMLRFKQWIAVPVFITALWLLFVLLQLNATQGVLITASSALLIVVLIRISRVRGAQSGKLFLGAIAAICIATIALQPPVHTKTADEMVSAMNAEPFNEARLAQLRAQGTPVFVDATATWCITCKFNERTALRSSEVRRYFAEQHIVTMVADWTRGDETITRYLASFGRNGVPLYVFYPSGKEPIVLPQLLTPSTVIEALQSSSQTHGE